ncbi:MAG: adenylate/guanylate cyclase domain-containing protein [Rhodocyclaceae bacterium]
MKRLATTPAPTVYQRWIGFIAVGTALVLFALSPLGVQIENNWDDTAFRLLRQYLPIAGDEAVVVVGIDDADLETFGTPLAILHRQIGHFLQATASGHARAVGLDLVLPQHSADGLQPGLDAALARGILSARKAAPLVLGLTTAPDGNPRPLHAPFQRLAGNEGTGFIFLSRDEDLVIRRFNEQIGKGGEMVPTLVGQLARALGLVPRTGLIQYALGQPFTYTPLRQVIAWQESGDTTALQNTFAGRVVLLGSVLEHDDQHMAPVPLAGWIANSETSHGVLIHAQQLRSVLAEATIVEWPASAVLLSVIILAGAWWLPPSLLVWLLSISLTVGLFTASLFALRAGIDLPATPLAVALLGALGARTGLAVTMAAQERKRLRASFGGLVSPPVLEEMLAGRLTPGRAGERRHVCVLFSDIRAFTTLSETMAPEAVTALLNDYFGRMTRAIHHHGGTLDKFIGDGIMAYFGAPHATANPCQQALGTAREMLVALDEFNRDRAVSGHPPIAIGIGLHYGPAVIGYIGSPERNDYSAIGDTVNTASRIEGLTKDSGFPLLLSAAVVAHLDPHEKLAPLGLKPVKGRSAIEVFGWPLPESMENQE